MPIEHGRDGHDLIVAVAGEHEFQVLEAEHGGTHLRGRQRLRLDLPAHLFDVDAVVALDVAQHCNGRRRTQLFEQS